MKKILSVFIIFTLMLTLFAGASGTALASAYSLSISPNPISAAAGESVSLQAKIQNNSGSDLANYTVQYGGDIYYSTDSSLATGQSVQVGLSKKLTVTSEMITQGSVKFDLCSNGSVIASCNAAVSNGAAEAKIGVTVTPDSSTTNLYAVGDVVPFAFKIVNQGQVAITGVTVKSGGKKVNTSPANPFDLAIGANQTVTYNYSFTKQVTLNFTIAYTANGIPMSYTVPAITIGVENRKVTATLTVDNNKPNAGENVNFNLEIKNDGNVTYTKMTVAWNGESWTSPASTLNPGDDLNKAYQMSFNTSEDVQLTVSMKDQKGNTVSVHTNTVSIYLPIDQNALKSGVTFTVKVDRKEMTSDGSVNFSGYVSNSSIYDLKNVTVTDQATGTTIFTEDELDAGKRENISQAVDVSATTTYNFVLTATDRDGQQYTFNTDPITITVLSSGVSPSAAPSGAATVTDQPLSTHSASDPLLVWIIAAVILVILIIGVGLALIVLWRQGASPVRASATKSSFGPSKPSYPRGKSPVKSSYGKLKGKGYKDRNHF